MTARDRLLRGGLLAAAVAAVVALDTGLVPLPFSTPVAPSRTSAAADPSGAGDPARSSGSSAAEPGEQARDAAVAAAATTMTSAVAAGDEKAFLSVLDPAATALVARMRQRFRNLRTIGYDVVTFAPVEHWSWPVPQNRVYAAAVDGVDPVVAAVDVRTKLEGWDPKASSTVLGLSFANVHGRWLVVADDDATDRLEFYRGYEPWTLGPVFVARTKHVVVVGEPKRKADLRRLANRVESSLGPVRAAWRPSSWNGRVVVYANTSKAFVNRWFGGDQTRNGTDGTLAEVGTLRTEPVIGYTDPGEKATPRMVVTPFLLPRSDKYSMGALRHELTHVVLAFEGDDRTPRWLVEGMAEYTAWRTGRSVDGRRALMTRGLTLKTWADLRRNTWKPDLVLSGPEFYGGPGTAVENHYTSAWLTCLWIADTYGEAKLGRLYTSSASMAPGGDQKAVEAAILSELKVSRPKLLAKVRAYAVELRRPLVVSR